MQSVERSQLAETLQAWKSDDAKVVVGVDVGATNTRVAFGLVGKGSKLQVAKFKCNLVTALISELSAIGEIFQTVFPDGASASCIASAGRQLDNGSRVEITNYDKSSTMLNLSDLPSALFPAGRTRLVNDLEGTCHGILALNDSNQLGTFFRSATDEKTLLLSHGRHLVMAMGTGLGVALIVNLHGKFEVLSLEAGHSIVSSYGPTHAGRDREAHMLGYLSQKLYKGQYVVEWEDICSGRGLGYVYDWLTHDKSGAPTGLDAAQISEQAMADPPNPLAREAMAIHYKYLLRCASNLAITTQPASIILAGDNQVSNEPFVASVLPELRAELSNAPKGHWMDTVQLIRQTQRINANIEGALKVATELLQ